MYIETFDQYRALAMRTDDHTRTPEQRLHNAALGLLGEFGEVCDLFKKHLYHGHPLDSDKLAKELGDLCWYLAVVADVLGFAQNITDTDSDFDNNFMVSKSDRNEIIEVALYLLYEAINSIAGRLINRDEVEVRPFMIEYALQQIDGIAMMFCEIDKSLDIPYTLSDVWANNIEKLQRRYTNGFSHEASINRVV